MAFSSVSIKDFRLDFRSKVVFNSAVTFVASVVVILILNGAGSISGEIYSSIFWITVLFLASISISDCFVRESDAGTSHILLLNTDAKTLFLGKLLYSFVSLLAPTAIFLVLSLFAFDLEVVDYWTLLAAYILGLLGVSLLSTFMGAVMASLNKGRALFPVLTIPVLIPLLAAVTDLTTSAFVNRMANDDWQNIVVLISFSGVFASLSFLTFEYIRDEL